MWFEKILPYVMKVMLNIRSLEDNLRGLVEFVEFCF